MMEELYKVMDDLLDVEFQMKSGIDLLKELEEFYMLEKETEKSDDTTLEKSNDKKKDKQESTNTIPEKCKNL